MGFYGSMNLTQRPEFTLYTKYATRAKCDLMLDRNMLMWFGQNGDLPTGKPHPRFTALPLGLNNYSSNEYAGALELAMTPSNVTASLSKKTPWSALHSPKPFLVAVNFGNGQERKISAGYLPRKLAWERFCKGQPRVELGSLRRDGAKAGSAPSELVAAVTVPKEGFATCVKFSGTHFYDPGNFPGDYEPEWDERNPLVEYYRKLSLFKYIICPRGNGMPSPEAGQSVTLFPLPFPLSVTPCLHGLCPLAGHDSSVVRCQV